jgi:uncharacterized protein (TIGR03083 family)
MSDHEPQDPTSKTELLQEMEQGWATFSAFIDSLTPDQLTRPTDAAGWTAKDHLIHLALWQDGISVLLEQKGETRWGAMGLDEATWAKDFDEMNAVIQQQNRDLPLETVLERLRGAHTRMFNLVSTLPEAALFYPYKHYDPNSTQSAPIIGWIVADSYEHYAEHTPWIAAIAAG